MISERFWPWIVVALLFVGAVGMLWYGYDLRTRPLGTWISGGNLVTLKPTKHLEAMRILVEGGDDGVSYPGLLPAYEQAKETYAARVAYSNWLLIGGVIVLAFGTLKAVKLFRNRRETPLIEEAVRMQSFKVAGVDVKTGEEREEEIMAPSLSDARQEAIERGYQPRSILPMGSVEGRDSTSNLL